MITVAVDQKGLSQALDDYAARLNKEAKITVGRLTLKLLTKVKQDKLSGQVLGVRSGRLRRSINQNVIANPNKIVGIVGTNVEYGRFWELGYSGSVSVKAHMRQIKMAFGKSIAPKTVQVSSHTRNVNVGARSFLGSALRDMQPEIMSDLQGTVDRVKL